MGHYIMRKRHHDCIMQLVLAKIKANSMHIVKHKKFYLYLRFVIKSIIDYRTTSQYSSALLGLIPTDNDASALVDIALIPICK